VDGLRDAVAALRAEWRLDFRVAQRVLEALRAGGSVGEVVARTAADRHDVEEVLRRVDPWLRRDGERYMLAAGNGVVAQSTLALDRDAAGAGPAGLQRARVGPDEQAVAPAMAEIAAGLPPPARELDHVLARPATMAARAGYFAQRYALAGATVLCVGDHDLTSVAVALAEPDAELLVVDVDQRVLEYIGRVAAERGLPITTAFADLRIGLPPSFTGRADLVFTDPPYTSDGVGLFLARGLQGLRRSGHERIAFAYGFAGRQLSRGFRTQSVLHELRLVVEALLPGFHRFDGAESIGAASDLYVCRPTRWTWPVVQRAAVADPRIYTRGPAAAEATPTQLVQSIVDEVHGVLGGAPARYLGGGWPAGMGGQSAADLAGFLTGQQAGPGAAAINLQPHFGALLPQAMLAAAAGPELTVLVVATAAVRAAVAGPVWTLLGASSIEVRAAGQGTEASLVVVRRRAGEPATPAEQVYAFLSSHPAAKVGNAWRDALVAVAGRQGETLTKNEARALIQAAGLPRPALQLRLGELPQATLAVLVAAVGATVPAVPVGLRPAHPRPAAGR
jgi:predicted methyltransferase